MKNSMSLILVLAAWPSLAVAGDISTSEVDCLQRQVQLKQMQDNLTIISQELAAISISKIPEAKLGGRIAEAKDNISKGVIELRSALKDACNALYK